MYWKQGEAEAAVCPAGAPSGTFLEVPPTSLGSSLHTLSLETWEEVGGGAELADDHDGGPWRGLETEAGGKPSGGFWPRGPLGSVPHSLFSEPQFLSKNT